MEYYIKTRMFMVRFEKIGKVINCIAKGKKEEVMSYIQYNTQNKKK
jgi:hypothetical protein